MTSDAVDEQTSAAPPWDDSDTIDGVAQGTVIGDQPERRDTAVACTATEARDLVARARGALLELDNTMTEIIRRRAWEPLGYTDPRTFWVKEFGPDSEGPNPLSKTHVYRTARVLAVLYGLSERLGDDALAIDISERALRSIPAGKDGANDVDLMENIQARVEEEGADDIQGVVDAEIKAAQRKFSTEAEDEADDQPDETDLYERMSKMGVTPPSDDAPGTDDAGTGDAGSGGEEAVTTRPNDPDTDPDTNAGISLSSAGEDSAVSAEVMGASMLSANLRRGLELVTGVDAENIGEVVTHLSQGDLQSLKDLATTAQQTLALVVERTGEALTDESGPIEIDDDDL